MSEVSQRLLKAQRNELHDIVASSVFTPAEFRWSECDGEFADISPTTVPTLAHTSSGYFFAIAQTDQGRHPHVYGDFLIQMSPGYESAITRSRGLDWPLVVIHFRDWLDRIRLDAEQPDLWTALESSGALTTAIGARAANFSEDDRQLIRDGFREVAAAVRQAGDLTTQQIEELEQLLVEAGEATERLTPKDWKNALVGAFVGWVLAGAVPSDIAKTILDHVVLVLAPLFRLPLLPR